MSWVKDAISALRNGQIVDVRPQGGSMRGLIESGQRVTLAPVDPSQVKVGDIVFVAWKGSYLLHLIKDATVTDVQIGNNLGKINGWAPRFDVIGRVVAIHPVDSEESRLDQD